MKGNEPKIPNAERFRQPAGRVGLDFSFWAIRGFGFLSPFVHLLFVISFHCLFVK